jgi:DNA recombination protein RmuC
LVESAPRYNAADAEGVEVEYPALEVRKNAAD